MAAAGYQLDVAFDEGETFEFTLPWSMKDGTPFPWADYAIDYALLQGGCAVFQLTSGAGIIVDPDQGTATFSTPSTRLRRGSYTHGCRVRHLTDGDTISIFDGTVTVSASPF